MFEILNTIENKTIFKGNESELVDFMKKIAVENEDYDFSFLSISDVEEYMEYCSNLELISK